MVYVDPLNGVGHKRSLKILREQSTGGSEIADTSGGENRTGSQYVHIFVCFQPSIRLALA